MIIKSKEASLLLRFIESQESVTKEHLPEAEILQYAGIVEYDENLKLRTTPAGERLAHLLKRLVDTGVIKHPDQWEKDYRWIGSEIIAMLDAANKGGRAGEISEAILKERGFLDPETRKLNGAGTEMLKIYSGCAPMLEINHQLAAYIRTMPHGPASTSLIKMGQHFEDLLEAMRLIAYSVPDTRIFTFTALGQAIKNALEMGGFVNEGLVVSPTIMSDLAAIADGRTLDKEKTYWLQLLGYLSGDDRLTDAGSWILEAYRLYSGASREQIWSIRLSEEALQVLLLIDEGSKVTISQIEEKLNKLMREATKLGAIDTQATINELEAFEFINRTQKNEEAAFSPTRIGKLIAKEFRKKQRGISSVSVKSITMTRKVFSSPNIEWYETAKKEGLVGSKEPTYAGYLCAYAAENVKRRAYLRKNEAQLLKQLPKNGLTVKELLEGENEKQQQSITRALDWLEALHLIEILPDGNIIQTEAGTLMKKALDTVPQGFATPVTPPMCRVLESMASTGLEYEKEKKIRIPPGKMREAQRISGLSDEEFSDAYMACKQAGYVGLNMITESGITVLKALKKMNPAAPLSGFFEIFDYKKESIPSER